MPLRDGQGSTVHLKGKPEAPALLCTCKQRHPALVGQAEGAKLGKAASKAAGREAIWTRTDHAAWCRIIEAWVCLLERDPFLDKHLILQLAH